MNKTLLTIAVLSFGSLVGCTGTDVIDCDAEPNAAACITACEMDPTRSHCSDGGTDAGPGDGGTDAGPDAFVSNCTAECTGETSICDEENSVCVQCLTPADCEGMGVNTMCSDSGSCVQCTGNEQCTEPGASVCATDGIMAGSCVGCTVGNAGDCTGVVDGATALNVCDDSAGSGVCVECNGRDESACGEFVCDVLAQTCTDDVTIGSAETCEACVSDTQCEDDLACVPVGATEPRGHYCMQNNSGGCGEPFTIDLTDRTSISGLEATTYCGINETLASCENIRSLLDNATCAGGTDEECPEGGLCRRVGSLLNRCTYECGGDVQCDAVPNPGASCGNETNMGMGPDYCGGEPEK